MLTAENITTQLGNLEILKDISLSLKTGEITALLGPNGAGKSSLIRALALIDLPKTGRITVDGSSYTFPGATDSVISPPWPKVTVVFQQHFLWPHLTIRNNIELPSRLRGQKDIGKELEGIWSRLDLADILDRYPNQVSGGQRQRAALARALLLKPSYILMDEITASLDVEQTREVLSYVTSLKDEGVGILISTHLISLAEQIADRVVFVDRGRITEEGPPAMLQDPRTERLHSFLMAR